MAADERWIGRAEALERLGVKTQTLYAYVSRGRIAARPDPEDPRRSLYAEVDIRRLSDGALPFGDAPRAPPQGAASRGEADLHNSLSLVAEGRLFYRGRDAAELSREMSVEEAARLLWDGPARDPFALLRPRVDVAPGPSVRARVFAALARRAEEDRSSLGRAPEDLKAEAASLLNETIDTVAGPGPRLFLHQRLGRGWKVVEKDAHLIRRALVLSADGAPTPPVLAARTAVAGGAPLAGAALAGLTTLTGARLFQAVWEASEWVTLVRLEPRRLASDPPVFADPDWPGEDPRAQALMAFADLPPDLLRVLEASGGRAAFPLALALVARRLDLPRTGACDLLLLGRLVGLIGHALDQAIDGSPIRARLRYVGPEPRRAPGV